MVENYEKKFWEILGDMFVGREIKEIDGKGGYINLIKVKKKYFKNWIEPTLLREINEKIKRFPDFKEELYRKLYSFFHRYFNETGSIYFSYTPLYYRIYEKVYDNSEEHLKEEITYDHDFARIISDKEDVTLFWKTHMLYYIKTDRIIRSMEIEIGNLKFYFDASEVEYKKGNEKKELLYEFSKIMGKTIVLKVFYKEGNRKTKLDEILKAIKKAGVKEVKEEDLKKAIATFEKQSNVDYFINKDAEKFLKEQFDLWMYQYLFSQKEDWLSKPEEIAKLQILKDIAYKIIEFISQFEEELKKIWLKPRFVFNSNYVITLDRIVKKEGGFELIRKILEHENFNAQVKEWKQLGIVDDSFNINEIIENTLFGKKLKDKYKHLPIDTKYFKDLELEILGLFDDLDKELDGWLIKSENFQALNTILPKFREKVQTIYIDPPYNSSSTEILYKNNYKHSSWLTLMENRISLAKKFLTREGIFEIAIDFNEQERLGLLIDLIFGTNINSTSNYEKMLITIIHNPKGRQGTNFSITHEYMYVIYPNIRNIIAKEKRMGEWRNLRDHGGESERYYAKNCFYPILIKDGKIIGFGNVANEDYHPQSKNIFRDDGIIEVWPIDDNGVERKWRYARNSVEDIKDNLKAKKVGNYWEIFLWKEDYPYKTVWTNSKYSATDHGTKTITNLFGIKGSELFTFPKSIHLVRDAIHAASGKFKNAIILDFFAGSGTTAHAVMKLNKEDGGKRKFILVEMADYFDTVIIPRIKKVAYSFNWKDGRPQDSNGIGIFFKYYSLEQYEDILQTIEYEDNDLSELYKKLSEMDRDFNPYKANPFLVDKKLLKAIEVYEEKGKVRINLKKLYPDKEIDLAETLSNLKGKFIKRITKDFVEFEDGEKINLRNIDYKLLKPLLWWE